MTKQARAKVGGEIGANGEHYEGGKFIATLNNPKSRKAAYQVTKRQEIEHTVWATPPVAGQRPIFGQLAGTFKLDHAANKFIANSLNEQTIAWLGAARYAALLAYVERYNAGERWF